MPSSQQSSRVWRALLEVQKWVAGVISEATVFILECSHGHSDILEAHLGFRCRWRSLMVGLRVRAGCLNFHFHHWRDGQWREGSNMPYPTANTDGRPRSQGAWDSSVTKLPPTWIPPSAMGVQKPKGHADTMVWASTVLCLQLKLHSVSQHW